MEEAEPLLPSTPPPTSPTAAAALPFSRRKHLISPPSYSSSPLCPLPEHDEVSIPISPLSGPPLPPSLKELLIFGASSPINNNNNDNFFQSSSPPSSPCPPIPPNPWPMNLHRSRTAPAMAAIQEILGPAPAASPRRPAIVRQSLLLLLLYLSLGVVVYSIFTSHFSADPTHPIVDALYFCIVTMCTIGYGDITPSTPFAKLFSVTFVLFGFGFIDILLSSMVSYVLDLQESMLLSSIHHGRHDLSRGRRYLVDVKKGRMRIRMKVGLALSVVFLCIGVGTFVLRFVESLGWLDSFYLSVMSVTTVGYGDRAFKTMPGRLFASIWLLVSTLAVARAFLYLAEARIDKRHRKIAKWVLGRGMTVSEFFAADIDHNGFVSKSEFVIYKLKEMGKITEKDILQICEQFEQLDTGNCGKITLADLMQSHLH